MARSRYAWRDESSQITIAFLFCGSKKIPVINHHRENPIAHACVWQNDSWDRSDPVRSTNLEMEKYFTVLIGRGPDNGTLAISVSAIRHWPGSHCGIFRPPPYK